MGLDQYLTIREYVSETDYSDYDYKSETPPPKNPVYAQILSLTKYSNLADNTQGHIEVSIPVGKWRKANQIHNWFVTNVQNHIDECQEVWVSREKMAELLKTCQAVITSPKLAEELLPTRNGSFFGSTDYDEYYFEDIKHTVKILSAALQTDSDSFYYSSSW